MIGEDVRPVPPVADGSARPVWSVMIPTYRAAPYVARTIESVLAQDPGPDLMQIEVVDDASDDGTPDIVRALAGERVAIHRQPANVGHIANFQTCLARARGRYVHLLHGDDFVLPGFYDALARGFEAAPDAGAAFCRAIYVDPEGRETDRVAPLADAPGLLADPLRTIATEQRIMTPSIAVRRSVYEVVGGFDRRLRLAEDWEMWVRIASRYQVWYDPSALACYRIRPASNTTLHEHDATDARYNLMAIRLFSRHIPKADRPDIVRTVRRTYAGSALATGRRLLSAGDTAGFAAQARAAVRLWPSPVVLARALRTFLTTERAR